MKRFLRSRLVLTLAAFLMIAAAIIVPLSGNIIGSHAQAATITPTNITGKFFTNTDFNNGTFNRTPSDTPVFTQDFQAINFNPDPSMQNCTPSTGVNQGTRPFTDVYSPIANGSCPTVIAQGNGAQAGVDNNVASLDAFEAEFKANLTVPSAGTMTSTITSDDGFSLYVGPNGSQQPTPAPGNPMVNPSGSTGPFTGYPEMGDNNQPSKPVAFTIVTNFPAAGTYPMELDYTEAQGQTLTLVMSNSFTPTAPPASISLSKVATPSVAPGGTITYTLTLTNTSTSGTLPLHDIQLTDTPPSPAIVSISAPSTPIITPSGGASVDCSKSTTHSLSCSVDDFALGAKVTVTFSAKVDPNVTPGGTITNKATAQSSVVSATASVSTSIRKILFVLIGGLTSDLTSTKSAFSTIEGTITSTPAFQGSEFLVYSYKGSTPNGQPQDYACELTANKHIADYVTLLNTQINKALKGNPHTDVYLIGHSVGGSIAYAYLASFEENLLGVSLLQGQDDQLKGVFTLDGSLGGVPDDKVYLNAITRVVDGNCSALVITDKKGNVVKRLPLVPFEDFVKVFATTSKTPAPDDKGSDPLGAQASIALALLGGDTRSNEQIAELASGRGIAVLTIGTANDLVWNPSACPGLGGIFQFHYGVPAPNTNVTDTQYIEDEGHASGAYGRVFTINHPCLSILSFSLSTLSGDHQEVLTNGDVQLGIMEVLQGQSPTSLRSPVTDKGPQ